MSGKPQNPKGPVGTLRPDKSPPTLAPAGSARDAPAPVDDPPANPLGQLLDRSVATDTPPPEGSGPGIAVALEWDGSDHSAPIITATGQGEMAEAILAKAFEAGVKVRKDADLVQILSVIDIGDEIPAESFVAVAEILSYVYNLNAALDPRGPAGAAKPRSSISVKGTSK